MVVSNKFQNGKIIIVALFGAETATDFEDCLNSFAELLFSFAKVFFCGTHIWYGGQTFYILELSRLQLGVSLHSWHETSDRLFTCQDRTFDIQFNLFCFFDGCRYDTGLKRIKNNADKKKNYLLNESATLVLPMLSMRELSNVVFTRDTFTWGKLTFLLY